MNPRTATRQQTKERHKNMVCKSYILKVDKSHLSKETASQLKRLFIEAKWFTNFVISQGIFEVDYKTKEIPVKIGDKFETRQIQLLSAQMRQGIVDKLKQDIKALAIKKKNGYKVGTIKFKRFIRTIPLKQFNVTYGISGKNHIRIQNIHKKLRARGLKQIPSGVEFANAYLIRDHGDYYLRVVTYQPAIQEASKTQAVGIDFGMRNQVTLSNGISIQYSVSLTKRLKRLYQSFSRKQKGSKNRHKAQVRLQNKYWKLNCIKNDIKNKIVHCIKENFSIVCFQDDNMKGWQRLWGRKVLGTAIGSIKEILKQRISLPVVVSKKFPSTRVCLCGAENQIGLDEEIYSCTSCGLRMHRDLKASISILYEGLNRLPVEHREAILSNSGRKACGEESSTLSMLGYLNSIPHVRARLLVETGSLSALA